MRQLFSKVYGSENYTELNGVAHGNVPNAVHRIDNNKNNCPDWIEWLFSDN